MYIDHQLGGNFFKDLVSNLNPVTAVKTITKQINRTVARVPVLSKITAAINKPILKAVAQAERTPIFNVAAMPIKKLETIVAPKKAEAAQAPQAVYQDEKGNVITKAQYDALMAKANEPIYQDAQGKTITKAEYDKLVAEASQPVYQDQNGNVITKVQYDALITKMQADAIAAQQPTYYDDKGNVITKAKYDELLKLSQTQIYAQQPLRVTVPGTAITQAPVQAPVQYQVSVQPTPVQYQEPVQYQAPMQYAPPSTTEAQLTAAQYQYQEPEYVPQPEYVQQDYASQPDYVTEYVPEQTQEEYMYYDDQGNQITEEQYYAMTSAVDQTPWEEQMPTQVSAEFENWAGTSDQTNYDEFGAFDTESVQTSAPLITTAQLKKMNPVKTTQQASIIALALLSIGAALIATNKYNK